MKKKTICCNKPPSNVLLQLISGLPVTTSEEEKMAAINCLQMCQFNLVYRSQSQMDFFCNRLPSNVLLQIMLNLMTATLPFFHWLALLPLGSFLSWYILTSKKYIAYMSHLIWKLLHMQEDCLIGSAQFIVSHRTTLISPIVF